MLELNGSFVIRSITEMERIKNIVNGMDDATRQRNAEPEVRHGLQAHVARLIDTLRAIGTSAAYIAAVRLRDGLADSTNSFAIRDIAAAIGDIQSRLDDELSLVRLFVLHSNSAQLFGNCEDLAGEDVSSLFPSAAFEIEEAAKCLGLIRATACAFHSMRTLEVGIRALAKHLGIPDPARPAEKNWAVVLKAIKDEIDGRWPASKRLPGTVGAKLEGLYAHLDAVRNPWRNATMHVETIYTEVEASHILNCVVVFTKKLAEHCDEDGEPLIDPTSASLPL
jgi:hypothetical protein